MTDTPPAPTRGRGRLIVDAINVVAIAIVLYAVSLTWDDAIDRTFDLIVVVVASIVLVFSLGRMAIGLRRR